MSGPKKPELDEADLLGPDPEDTADLEAALAATEERLHPILSNEEVLAARAEARANIEAKQRKAARTALIKAEEERLAQEEGLVTGDGVKDEMVSITLDLAEHSAHILLSGRPYYHGHTYKVPRHVADTLREIMSRGHDHQREIEGKPISDRFRRPHATVIDTRPGKGGAITNAPQYVSAL